MPEPYMPDRCDFRDRIGRRCRLSRAAGHPSFCIQHARKAADGTVQPPAKLAAELFGPNPQFQSIDAVNCAVGRILNAFFSDRISSRDAAVAGYLCQLLLQTIQPLKSEAAAAAGPQFKHPIIEFRRARRSGYAAGLKMAREELNRRIQKKRLVAAAVPAGDRVASHEKPRRLSS